MLRCGPSVDASLSGELKGESIWNHLDVDLNVAHTSAISLEMLGLVPAWTSMMMTKDLSVRREAELLKIHTMEEHKRWLVSWSLRCPSPHGPSRCGLARRLTRTGMARCETSSSCAPA